MGLFYASGPLEQDTAKPSSPFRKGDILVYDSNSSLSRAADLPAAGTIVGVADADSTDSLDDLVPYTIAREDTVFWSDISTAVASVERGEAKDLGYITFPDSNSSEWVMLDSANTPGVRVDHAGSTHDVIDSATSRVRVRFDPTILLYST